MIFKRKYHSTKLTCKDDMWQSNLKFQVEYSPAMYLVCHETEWMDHNNVLIFYSVATKKMSV